MSNSKLAVIVLLTVFICSAFVNPVFAVDYNLGVSTGQYVKYGNFVGVGAGLESFNNYDYLTVQITSISGNEVTLLSTGQIKNGSAIPGNGSTALWNVETGTLNGIPSFQGPIIAANLNTGDPIPPPYTYAVNKTETRSYLGISRIVNILNLTITTTSYSTTLTYVYDRASGMLLETQSITEQSQLSETLHYAYSIVETNIFGSSTPTTTPGTSGINTSLTQQIASPTTSTTLTLPLTLYQTTELPLGFTFIIAVFGIIIILGGLKLRKKYFNSTTG
jgi:hypothetical protein